MNGIRCTCEIPSMYKHIFLYKSYVQFAGSERVQLNRFGWRVNGANDK